MGMIPRVRALVESCLWYIILIPKGVVSKSCFQAAYIASIFSFLDVESNAKTKWSAEHHVLAGYFVEKIRNGIGAFYVTCFLFCAISHIPYSGVYAANLFDLEGSGMTSHQNVCRPSSRRLSLEKHLSCSFKYHASWEPSACFLLFAARS